MATDKRIGPCNTRRVRLLHGSSLNNLFGILGICFGTELDALLFCPNEQYLGVYLTVGIPGSVVLLQCEVILTNRRSAI